MGHRWKLVGGLHMENSFRKPVLE